MPSQPAAHREPSKPGLQTRVSLFLTLLLVLAGISVGLLADNHGIRLSQQQINELARTYGEPARRRLTAWQQLLVDLADADEMTKLREVNLFSTRSASSTIFVTGKRTTTGPRRWSFWSATAATAKISRSPSTTP
ncbi:hypothetical protein [Marinobacterium aestuariivivens]|uniref:Uncharacterized protein n=1 Tax=Marinobacterium aestuariivivens TaxID=1698799 RepID=A0ABW2A810_9GAMM